ncbi:glycosyltransferase [Blastococcus sp. SYSU D00669]
MRFLVSSNPGLGHLHPVLPLALAAAAAGHEVRVATGADQVPWVERCGATAVPAGLPLRAMVEQADARGLVGPERPRHLFTTIAVPPMAADLLALVDGWRPDVLVHEEGEYAAPLVGALRGLPVVTHSWSSPARTAAGRQLLVDPLDAVWVAAGAAGSARQTGGLYLDACPPRLQVPDVEQLGVPVVTVRPTAFDGPAVTAPDLEALPRPALYVTLGTVPASSRPDLLQRLADAAADVARGVVVATGPNPPDVVRAAHPGVRVVAYVPQSLVLPHVDAVVSHGGAGTTVGALLAGLPLLVLPGISPSQRLGAERVVAAGLGLRLEPDEATPGRLRAAVAELLERDDLRAAAAEAAAGLASLPGPDELVPLLERATA